MTTQAGIIRRQLAAPGRAALWRLATPLIAANLSVAVLTLTDTAVVGYLPRPHFLAGVALGGTVFSFLYWGLGFLRMGTAGLAAQAAGAGDGEALRAVLVQALVVGLACAGAVLVLQWPIVTLALAVAQASPEVSAQAARYFGVRVWGAPFTLSLYVLLGMLLALRDGRAALLVLAGANAVNVALDLLLVVGLGLGVAGVAGASVCAEALGVALAVWRLRVALRTVPGGFRRAALRDRTRARRLLAVNRDILVRTLCLLFSFAFFNVQAGRLGDAVLAACAVLLSLHLAAAQVLDGIANASEALVGQAVGAGDRPGLRQLVRIGLLDSLAVGGAFLVVYALAGGPITGLLTDLPAVRALAREYLPWLAVLPLLAAPAFLLDGVFIGATRSREMRQVMMLALLGAYLPVWWFTRPWGAHGLWAAFAAMTAARSVLMYLALRRMEARGGLSP